MQVLSRRTLCLKALIVALIAVVGISTVVSPATAKRHGRRSNAAGPKNVTICPDKGDWVFDGSGWTLDGANDLGSRKFDVAGDVDNLFVSAPSGYLVSGYCAKAGTTTENLVVDPPQATQVPITVSNRKAISHFSLTFVKEQREEGQWCSPGFWRNNADKHGANQWPVSTGTLYNTVISSPSVAGNPTLLAVLQSPNTYGGAAFNAVGTYLSQQAGLNVVFDENGDPIHNCPLDQQGNSA